MKNNYALIKKQPLKFLDKNYLLTNLLNRMRIVVMKRINPKNVNM